MYVCIVHMMIFVDNRYLGDVPRSNGDSFDGEFVDGVFHLGRYFYAASGESYRGPWSNGKRHGKGIYTYGQEIQLSSFLP